jgi:outer membrane lipoprotein carrier protein
VKKLIHTFIAVGFLSGGWLPLHANEAGNLLSSDAARQVVQEFIESTQSYQADFTQILQNNSGEALEEEAGQLWLLRPGQFRWEYTVPWERQIVANEESIWLYDAELEQVTVRSAEGALLGSPAALLVGDMSALEDYAFRGNRKADGTVMVTLEPLTGHGDFVAIGLGFAEGELVLLELYDRFDQHTLIHFSSIIRNPALNPDLFNFELPDGADVIDQRIN